jgi:hypothetical protein
MNALDKGLISQLRTATSVTPGRKMSNLINLTLYIIPFS